ncbi:heme lyase CcmF/NrfE family subunit [Sphingorhabdus sp.]|uniref:heme lyase CcmF/NrfE family subunit n=1 Tax=Sphingorhabdus sp. TaxID=1902408 RepID=UPI0033426C03
MIAEAGLAAIWLAASMALLQFIAGLTLLRAGAGQLAPLIKPAAYMQCALCTFAFFALMWLFYITDLSVLLVANNSHIDKPLIFKLAGTWGNHEGSMLLWVTILAVSGAAIAFLEKRIEVKTLSATLAVQGFLALGFFAFLLFSSNPFERMVPAPIEGAGLNPLLQDVGLAFHPPTLYFGYVGLSIAFSLAVGALLTNQVGPAFARAMRPWVLGAWIFLTIGIAAGSYWAYYELGWGGWWFWDPVENASLMPWLAATALLHSVSVLATRNALRAWTVMLALVAFAMSMAGTFLVRSGILTSVHAFAVDPERGSFILALMLMYTGLAFVIFALRIGTVKQGELFQLLSREGGIVANNVFLSVILAVILIGTLYPIAAEALGDKISVGPPYFNKATVPIAVLLMLALLVGPLLRWRRDGLGRLKYWLIGAAAILLLSCLAIWKFAPEIGIFPLLGIALSSALAVAAWMPLRGRKLLRTPIPVFGMVIAHFGLAVSVFGMAAESGFSSETLTALAPGESAKVAGWEVKLNDVNPVVGDNWVAVEGEMIAAKNGNEVALHPQSRQFFKPPMQTSEAALLTRWNGQLYVVIAQPDQEGDGRWQVRLWWKPFVTFIWYGAILIALGGAIALLGRMGRRTKKPAINTWQTE